jgi:hypothetical protein
MNEYDLDELDELFKGLFDGFDPFDATEHLPSSPNSPAIRLDRPHVQVPRIEEPKPPVLTAQDLVARGQKLLDGIDPAIQEAPVADFDFYSDDVRNFIKKMRAVLDALPSKILPSPTVEIGAGIQKHRLEQQVANYEQQIASSNRQLAEVQLQLRLARSEHARELESLKRRHESSVEQMTRKIETYEKPRKIQKGVVTLVDLSHLTATEEKR